MGRKHAQGALRWTERAAPFAHLKVKAQVRRSLSGPVREITDDTEESDMDVAVSS